MMAFEKMTREIWREKIRLNRNEAGMEIFFTSLRSQL